MANLLPRYFALSTPENSSRFLEYIHEDVPTHGLIAYQGDQVLSPFTKLESVDAGNGRVHIRCCYNTKFLAIRSETDYRISPVAEEPVTDQSSWSCTLFGIERVTNTLFSVRHLHLGRRLYCKSVDPILRIHPNFGETFHVHDLSSMLALNLPRFVAFTAHNGHYARLHSHNIPYVEVQNPGKDWHIDILHEILPPDGDGFVRFRNVSNGRCWRRDPYRVLADTGSDRLNLPAGHNWLHGSFKVERLSDDNVVALRCANSPLYLTGWDRMLTAETSTLVPEARFVMEEPVRSRDIYNVRFNLTDAKIRIEGVRSMGTQSMRNGTSVAQNFERTFTYSITKTRHWNAIVSASLGMAVTIRAGLPFLLQKEITFSAEISASYEWGKLYSETVTEEDKVPITAPPMTIVSVTRFETQGSYDIPFSYTQQDILWDGQSMVAEKDDGLYVGANNFDIYYDVREEPILSSVSSDTQPKEVRTYRIRPQSSPLVPLIIETPSSAPAESLPVPAD